MKKNLSLIAVLIFVLSFGSLVFAQNANSSTMGNMNAGTAATPTMGRRHGRRRGRRGRRRGRRRHRRGGRTKTGGNTNT